MNVVMFLLGALLGIIGVIILACYAAVIDDEKKNDDKE